MHSAGLLLHLLACRLEAHLKWASADTATVFASTTWPDQHMQARHDMTSRWEDCSWAVVALVALRIVILTPGVLATWRSARWAICCLGILLSIVPFCGFWLLALCRKMLQYQWDPCCIVCLLVQCSCGMTAITVEFSHGPAAVAVKRTQLQDGVQQKILSLLPSVTFGSLLEHAPSTVQEMLGEHSSVGVAAPDAQRGEELLAALGPVLRGGKDDFKQVCSAWKVVTTRAKPSTTAQRFVLHQVFAGEPGR